MLYARSPVYANKRSCFQIADTYTYYVPIFSFVTELEISFLSLCILRHETFEIDDVSSMQDDPLCNYWMSWLINEKSIAMRVNFRS